MPPTLGFNDYGFKAKEFSAIKAELEAELRKEIDPQLHFGPGSIAGVLTAIVAHQSRQVWESLNGLYHSLQPNMATGKALDSLCILTGTFRKPATFSKGKLSVTLEAKTTLPKESRIQTLGGHLFKTTDEVKNEGTAASKQEVGIIAEEAGPLVAHPKTMAKIMTPIAGWYEAIVKETSFIGNHQEDDASLRKRRIDELRADGTSTLDALYARLALIKGVEAIHIQESARSFEVVIKGGNDEEIAYTIWKCKPLGIDTTGSVTVNLTDSIGQTRTINFTRPQVIDFKLHAILVVKSILDQNEVDLLKNTLLDFAASHFKLGEEMYASRFYGIFLEHQKILDIKNLSLSEGTPSSPPRRSIEPHQIASLSFADITIQQVIGANG
jgi:uncharacterized phage protein gp47/JayE